MHPAFTCFEWGMFEVGRLHPDGHPVHPHGLWAHAVLSLRRTGEEVGEAWYLAEGPALSVDVRVAEGHGGRDDPWLIRLVGDTLFAEGGFLDGYYEQSVAAVAYRNLSTGGWWRGSWPEMRGRAEPGAAPDPAA